MSDTSVVLTEWIEPVTDRTQSDVDRLQYLLAIPYSDLTAEQKTELAQDSKGALNKSDLNRILNDIALLYESFGFTRLKHLSPSTQLVPSVGLVPGLVEFMPDDTRFYRVIPEIPRVSFYQQLLDAIILLRNTLYIYQSTPLVPQQALNTFQKWNDIEQILYDIHDLVMIVDYDRSGNELYAGQAIGVI